jgi:isopentenyl diphosphate isomerase/L-lactate dehydrogenase-like FMN-dependent dehydrogenase
MVTSLARRRFLAWLAQADEPEPLNILEWREAARRALPPAHFGYIETGVDDDATLRENTEAFRRIPLRPRRLVDVTKVDLSVELFGRRWPTPIVFQPCGSQKAFHPDGERAVARAARERNVLQVLSTASTTSIEDVHQERGEPGWFQLYATNQWAVTERLVRRAEAAGAPVLVLTVDLPAGRNTETEQRYRRQDQRACAACHGDFRTTYFRRKPMFEGVGLEHSIIGLFHPAMDWAFVDRLRRFTRMKLVLKGIVDAEDARLAREHGADGLVVSNHGGRAEESLRATIDCLPEIHAAVGGAMPIILDGGIRRGTDIYKALLLGATAVGIGRPYLWGLAAQGQTGVARVHQMLTNELELVMKQCGSVTLPTPALRSPAGRPSTGSRP